MRLEGTMRRMISQKEEENGLTCLRVGPLRDRIRDSGGAFSFCEFVGCRVLISMVRICRCFKFSIYDKALVVFLE